MTHEPRARRKRTRTHGLLSAVALVLIAGPATAFSPTLAGAQTVPTSGNAPLINLTSGQNIEGTVPVIVEPVTENDSVTTLTIDGDKIDADRTAGTAHFAFEMGGNGTEARYRNYLTVNGHTAEADRVYLPDIPGGQVGTLDFPGDWLHAGANTVAVHTGANWVDTTTKTAVGYEELPNGEGGRCPNYDDYTLSSISLSLLGVVADGEQNLFSYTFGDGTCGSSSKLLNQDLTFVISGEPGSTSRPARRPGHHKAHKRYAHRQRDHPVGREDHSAGGRQQLPGRRGGGHTR